MHSSINCASTEELCSIFLFSLQICDVLSASSSYNSRCVKHIKLSFLYSHVLLIPVVVFLYVTQFPNEQQYFRFLHNSITSLYPEILDKHVPSSLINTHQADSRHSNFALFRSRRPAGRGVKVVSAVGPQLREASPLFPRPSAVADLPGDTMQLSWVRSLGSEHPWEAGREITYRLKIPTLPHQIRQREGMELSGVDIGPLGGGEGRTPSSISKETLKCCHLHTGSVVSPVVLMAERALEEDVAQERREMGGKSVRTQRWTQPCVKQATHREPKKWVSEGTSGLCSKGFKMFGYKE